MNKPAIIIASALLAVLMASEVVAAPPTAEQQALAERLFRAGKANMDQGSYGSACPQLEESMRQDPGGGTQLTLALCYEGAGRTASAWAAHLEAAAQARRDGREDREVIATEHAKALEARLINLTLSVPPEVAALPGLTITRNGLPIAAVSFGVAAPVDPGEHEFSVVADGYQAWTVSIAVSEQQPAPTLSVPMLIAQPVVAEPVAAQPVVAGPTEASPTSAAEREPRSGLSRKNWGYVVGGAGVVSLTVGTIFGIRAVSKANAVNDACPDRECDRRFEGDFAAWETASRVADITVGLGLLGVGIGAYMIVSSDSESELSVGAMPSTAGAAFELRRTF